MVLLLKIIFSFSFFYGSKQKYHCNFCAGWKWTTPSTLKPRGHQFIITSAIERVCVTLIAHAGLHSQIALYPCRILGSVNDSTIPLNADILWQRSPPTLSQYMSHVKVASLISCFYTQGWCRMSLAETKIIGKTTPNHQIGTIARFNSRLACRYKLTK
jgi:hypothetical protein